MFRSVLIANRGEIACRVVATCRRLGIRAVAVFSGADADALHVRSADEAVPIGPAESAGSYLDIDAVLDAARRTAAEAVHPGYGFLSENAEFAEACADAGIVFVGPPPDAIRAMGSKSAAKALAADAGVPVLPGYHGDDQDDAALAEAAMGLGFPLLVKPVGGGGGRGMRRVETPGEIGAALASARREAAASFGDDRLLLERCLARPRHVEIQVFADGHGNAVQLFERDCSVQRRRQKVIEEAPAPLLDEETRAGLARSALDVARAVGYVGAGTVEFLVEPNAEYFFIEMNTRLQVEHPVTELITGLDLVEWQLRVAAGEALPMSQDRIAARGHAVEARLCAEDPIAGFLPSTGRILHFGLPETGPWLRVDTGFAANDSVTPYYDSLLAKIVAWGKTRTEALARLEDALAKAVPVGLATNRDFLIRILRHPVFVAGAPDIDFVERFSETLTAPPEDVPARVLAAAAFAEAAARRERRRAAAAALGDPHAPWAEGGGWRLNAAASESFVFRCGSALHEVELRGKRVFVSGRAHEAADADVAPGLVRMTIEGAPIRMAVHRAGGRIWIFTRETSWEVLPVDPLSEAQRAAAPAADAADAPMPGRVVAVEAVSGSTVEAGDVVMVIEAMKVEHVVRAPAAGLVEAVHYRVGDTVEEGARLFLLVAGGTPP